MPPALNVHVGVCAWVVQDGAALMLQRAGVGKYASDGHGEWALPGGWLEFDEDPWDAAVREVMEETGVEVVALGSPAWTCAKSYDDSFQIVTLIIECGWVSGQPQITEPDKSSAVEWVPVNEIIQRPLFAPTAMWMRRLGAIERASFRAA